MSVIEAVTWWYLVTTLGWFVVAIAHRRRRLIDYLWCVIWPIGLAVHWNTPR